MAFDGIILKKVIDELQILENAKVNKIFQPSNNNIVINVYRGKNYSINIDVSASDYGIYITKHNKKNPIVAPNFCMTLRKYLTGAKIKRIYMHGLERICFIEFETHNEMNDLVNRTLAIELMGKYSNIVLCNEKNMIIDALKKFDGNGSSRDIMPTRFYELPEQPKIEFTNISESDFIKIANDDKEKIQNTNKENLQNTNEEKTQNANKEILQNKIVGTYPEKTDEKRQLESKIKNGSYVNKNKEMSSNNKRLETVIPNKFVGISKLFIQSATEELHISNTISDKSLKEIYEYINKILNSNDTVFKKYKNSYTVFSEEKNNVQQNDKENNNSTQEVNTKQITDTRKDETKQITNTCKDEIEQTNNVKNNDTDNLKNNYFLDNFYNEKANQEAYVNYRNMVLKILNGTLDKLLKKMDNINEKIKSCENMEQYKIYGEILIANIYKFDNKSKTYNNEVDSKETNNAHDNFNFKYEANKENTQYAVVENYYDNNNKIEIPIDCHLSISKNAEKYFKKYNKLKNTVKVVNIQKKETEKELYYLESLIQEMDNCITFDDVDAVYNEISENLLFNTNTKSKNKKNKNDSNDNMLNNYIRLVIDNYDVFVGKNNKQNDYLTLKVAHENDMWFHTKEIHGSHLILRCNGEMPKLETIEKCAKISAYYSKAKFSSHVPVDYTLVKNVHKPRGANPGFVIYTNYKTIYVDPSIEEVN